MRSARSKILRTALWLTVATAACQRPDAGPTAIRLGVVGPFSGSLEPRIGSYVREGAVLAVEQINGRGGLSVAGRRLPVELVFEDSEDRPEAAVQAARKLISQDGVVALVGPLLSRNALAAAVVAENKATPMISPASTHVELTAGRRYVFRASLLDDLEGRALALFARDELGAVRAAVLYDVASAHNRSVAELFRQVFEEAGGRVVAFETYTTGARDFRPLLERIRAVEPDVLLLPNYVDEVPLQARQAREQGLGATLLGSDSWDAEIYPGLADFEGSFFTDDWLPEIPELASPESDAFIDAYRRRHGRPATSISALTYDAVGLMAAAIERSGGLDGEAICQALRTTSDYRGVTGTLSFPGNGDPIKGVGVFKIADGRVSFHQRIQP